MAYFPKLEGTLRFKHGPWTIAIFAIDTGGIGEVLVIGHGDDVNGFTGDSIIDGPGDIAANVAAAGGMGNYIYSKLPAINEALKNNYDLHPFFAPENNMTPYSAENLNIALWEYFEAVPSPDGDYPILQFKPYTPNPQ